MYSRKALPVFTALLVFSEHPVGRITEKAMAQNVISCENLILQSIYLTQNYRKICNYSIIGVNLQVKLIYYAKISLFGVG
jgi:hypothetical protein